jgi:hypothetical protein
LDAFSLAVTRGTKIDDTTLVTYICSEGHKYYFDLAVSSALRNTIRHTWEKENPYICIKVEEFSGIPHLVIRNSSDSLKSGQTESKLQGTLGAIQRYVSRYSKDIRHVSLRQIDQKKTPNKDRLHYHEEWETVLPLPDAEVGL